VLTWDGTGDIAKKVGKSNGRISQSRYLKCEAYRLRWQRGAVSASLAQSVVKATNSCCGFCALQVPSREGRKKFKPDDLGRTNSMNVLRCIDKVIIDCSDESKSVIFT